MCHLGESDHITHVKDLEKVNKIDEMFKWKADDGKQVGTNQPSYLKY